MDQDKQNEMLEDAILRCSSKCCGADMVEVNDGVGRCCDCKEMSEVVQEE